MLMAKEPRSVSMTVRITERHQKHLERAADAESKSVADLINELLEKRWPREAPYAPRLYIDLEKSKPGAKRILAKLKKEGRK